jgi:hypothetical protein
VEALMRMSENEAVASLVKGSMSTDVKDGKPSHARRNANRRTRGNGRAGQYGWSTLTPRDEPG